MKFPYIEFRGRRAPIVPIELYSREWIKFNGYVDSGAGYCVFHARIAEMLGLKSDEGEKIYVMVGDGSQITVYLHKINIRLAGEEFEARIGFSRQLGIGFNIIGRLDVFDRFKICFDEIEKFIEFHSKKDTNHITQTLQKSPGIL